MSSSSQLKAALARSVQTAGRPPHTGSPSSPVPLPATVAPTPAAQPNGGWTEHKAPDGRTYYYHKASGKSSWEKPDEMKTDAERALNQAAGQWKEYTSAGGKKYYYNSVTKQTQWTIPEELQAALTKEPPHAASAPAAPARAANTPTGGAPSAAPTKPAAEEFCELLVEAGCKPSMSWEEAMKLIINRPNYRVLATLAERKSTFLKWAEELREAEEERERKKLRHLKIEFVNMLKECKELTSRTRYAKVIELFQSDPRWSNLEDELEREELFEEYSLSLERKETADRRNLRKERMAAFKALLAAKEIGVRAQWRQVQAQLDQEEAFRAIEKIDRLQVFEEYIRELEQLEEQQKQKQREATRREERRKRDQFRSLLGSLHEEGKINFKTKWKDVVETLTPTDAYRAAVEQPGSTPAELFADFIDQLEQQWQSRRRIMKPLAPTVTETSPFDEFETQIRAADETNALEGIPVDAIKAYWQELQTAAVKEKEEDERRTERRNRQLMESYQSALRGLMGATLTAETTWEEVSTVMQGKSAAQALSEELQQNAFNELLSQLKASPTATASADVAADEGADEASEKKKKKKKHRGSDEDGEDEERRKRKKKSS
ncbi:hypothetical protein AB1Y20_000245 [Prymnesium parvum]|uniref:Pre-mRNA-processing factor 40 homolog B n=1 Tax=Prymnesium parvum TaxID=97485 RepID=A0AB34K8U6_PRYPA